MKRLPAWMIVSALICVAASCAGPKRSPTAPRAPRAWENREGIPPVGDQRVAGSCYSWSSAYYYLTHLQWLDYRWDVSDPAHQGSPAFVYNLTNGGVDNGAWKGESARADAFALFETLGCATMADMGYDYRGYGDFPSENAFRGAMRFRTAGTRRIELRADDGLKRLKAHLAGGDLAVLGIEGYANLNGIGRYDDCYCLHEITGGRLYWHDVTVVGYDDERRTADGRGAFRIVNSWGPFWGDRGYFWMSYEAVKSPMTSCGYALYAIDRRRYEPSLAARAIVRKADRYDTIIRAVATAGLAAEGKGDSIDFLDFSPMSIRPGVLFPESAVLLDLSDLESKYEGGTIRLSLMRKGRNPPIDGSEILYEIEDLGSKKRGE